MKRIFSIYFFPFLNTQVPIFGWLGRKTVLRCTYLFRRVHFLDSLLLRGSDVSLESGGKVPVIFCPKILFRSFPGVLATVSTHLVTPTGVLKFLSFRGRNPGVWLQFSTCLHADCCLRNKISLSNFLWPKAISLARRALANHLASFLLLLLLHLTRSCYSFGLLQWPISPSLSNQLGVMECR